MVITPVDSSTDVLWQNIRGVFLLRTVISPSFTLSLKKSNRRAEIWQSYKQLKTVTSKSRSREPKKPAVLLSSYMSQTVTGMHTSKLFFTIILCYVFLIKLKKKKMKGNHTINFIYFDSTIFTQFCTCISGIMKHVVQSE